MTKKFRNVLIVSILILLITIATGIIFSSALTSENENVEIALIIIGMSLSMFEGVLITLLAALTIRKTQFEKFLGI